MNNVFDDFHFKKEYIDIFTDKNSTAYYEKIAKNDSQIIISGLKSRINEDYYDLQSPPGYSGIYLNCNSEHDKKHLLGELSEILAKDNIIASFHRFHPDNHTVNNHQNIFSFVAKDRPVIYIKIKEYNINGNLIFPKKTRYTIRTSHTKANFKTSKKIFELHEFYNLYTSTMDKNNASKEYYYTFEQLQKAFTSENIIYISAHANNHLVAGALFIISGHYAYYFLSANSQYSYENGVNYSIIGEAVNQVSHSDVQYLILGGGRTTLADDSLLKFKRKFSKYYFEYQIGGLVHQEEIFNRLNTDAELKAGRKISQFLKYRFL